MEENQDPKTEVNKGISDNNNKSNSEEITVAKSEKIIEQEKEIKINNDSSKSEKIIEPEKEIKINNDSSKSEKIIEQEKEIKINNDSLKSKKTSEPDVDSKNIKEPPAKTIPKPKKELPIEKKPFQEFINIHLIPELTEEINQRGLKINNINLKNTNRPIAGDKCWVINCDIKDTCSFWLSFEKEDISSLKSISLSKPNQNPSIIESFLIDEKRITLKLIISRILQRLNGQKLIGIN